MDYETLQIENNDRGIRTIILSRPDKLNALSALVLNELEHALIAAESDPKVKGLILTGTGKAFCAGADIKELAAADVQSGLAFARRGQAVFRLLETIGKPSIAAINGFAFGGGCELAMAASLRIASDKAQFGQPEVKLGVIPGYGGTQRLARLVGKGRALDLCLSGRFIAADVALQWGLVTELTSEDDLLKRAHDIMNTITAMAPFAIASVLDVIDAGFDMGLEDGLHLEAVHFANTCGTQDKQEGVAAFLEKRAPNFTGK